MVSLKSDPIAVDNSPPESEQEKFSPTFEEQLLGDKIREIRLSRGLSLKELGMRCALSVPLLSQIERGVSSPSMRSLRQISNGLGIPVEKLFSHPAATESEESPNIVRHDKRRILNLAKTGISMELLTTPGSGDVQCFFANIISNGSSGPEYDSHLGSESGVIMTGQLELWLDGVKHLLNPGDSFCFNSQTPHRYLNPGNSVLQAYWVISPPIY